MPTAKVVEKNGNISVVEAEVNYGRGIIHIFAVARFMDKSFIATVFGKRNENRIKENVV